MGKGRQSFTNKKVKNKYFLKNNKSYCDEQVTVRNSRTRNNNIKAKINSKDINNETLAIKNARVSSYITPKNSYNKLNYSNSSYNETENNSNTCKTKDNIASNEEFASPTKQKIKIFSNINNCYNKSINYSNKFNSIIKFIDTEKDKISNIKFYRINSDDSVFYAHESTAPRSENYRKILEEFYEKDYSIYNKESHHAKLDRSSEDPRFLVFLSKETHKKIHEILDIENKIEVLEYFKSFNFEHKNIELNGVGTTFRHGIYSINISDEHMKDTDLYNRTDIDFDQKRKILIDRIIDSLTMDIYTILESKPNILDELEFSLGQNKAYQNYIKPKQEPILALEPIYESLEEKSEETVIQEEKISNTLEETILNNIVISNEVKQYDKKINNVKKFFTGLFACFPKNNNKTATFKDRIKIKKTKNGVYESLI